MPGCSPLGAKPLWLAPILVVAAFGAFARPYAYLGNLASTDVSVIDTATDRVVATVPLGGVGGSTGVALHPDGTRAYIGWAQGVSIVDARTLTARHAVTVGEGFGLAVLPNGTQLYATDRYSVPFRVRAIDATSGAVVATIPVASRPTGVAASPDGRRVYVAAEAGKIWIIDPATNALGAPASIDLCFASPSAIGVAVSPDGRRLYATTGDRLCVLDTKTGAPVAVVPLDLYSAWGVAVNPSGTRVYVAGSKTYSGGPGQLSVVDAATNGLIATRTFGSSAEGVAVHPDGTRVYVTSRFPGMVTVLRAGTYAVVASIALPGEPMAFGPFIETGAASTPAQMVPAVSPAMLALTGVTLAMLALGSLCRRGAPGR